MVPPAPNTGTAQGNAAGFRLSLLHGPPENVAFDGPFGSFGSSVPLSFSHFPKEGVQILFLSDSKKNLPISLFLLAFGLFFLAFSALFDALFVP